MAEILGITLKGVKSFKGHEGEPLMQGNIYYKGVKVGEFSEDSWGGPNRVDIINPETEKAFEEIYKQFVEKFPEYDWDFTDYKEDCFWAALMKLIDAEKEYKKNAKKGYPRMIEFSDIHDFETHKPVKYPMVISFIDSDEVQERVIKEHSDYDEYKVYKSFDDFILK